VVQIGKGHYRKKGVKQTGVNPALLYRQRCCVCACICLTNVWKSVFEHPGLPECDCHIVSLFRPVEGKAMPSSSVV